MEFLDEHLLRLVRRSAGRRLWLALPLVLWLALPLLFRVRAETAAWISERLPAVAEQLPAMEIRGGRLVVDPPLEEPLTVVDRDGRPLLLLDPDSRLGLESSEARVQLTATRLLVADGRGRVQAFPLSDWPDMAIDGPGLPDAAREAAGAVLLLAGLPALLLVAGFAVLLQQALLVSLLGLPLRLHDLPLEPRARWRLASAAQTPVLLVAGLALWGGVPVPSLPWIGLVLELGLLLLFLRRLDVRRDACLGPN